MYVQQLYDSSIIANNIKTQAKAKGITIKELLTKCQLGINTVSKLALGTDIYSKNLAKIADCLDCSVDYLLGRTNSPKPYPSHKQAVSRSASGVKMTILPFYRTPSSAGSGSILFDDVPIEYINVPKNAETEKADFVVEVRGDSMEPQFYNGDHVLVAADRIIQAGEIGVFVLDGDSFIKKMGEGRLISLNPAYAPIELHEYDSIQCAGKVIGTIDLQ